MENQDTSITSLPRQHALGLAKPHDRVSGIAQRCDRLELGLGIVLWSGLIGLILTLAN